MKLIHYLLSNFLPWGLGSRQGAVSSSRRGNHFCIHGRSQLGQNAKAPCMTIPQLCKLSLDNCALTCHGHRGQAKNLDPYLSHFADLPSPVMSAATIMPLHGSKQALLHTPNLLLSFILLTQAKAPVFLSLSFHPLLPLEIWFLLQKLVLLSCLPNLLQVRETARDSSPKDTLVHFVL